MQNPKVALKTHMLLNDGVREDEGIADSGSKQVITNTKAKKKRKQNHCCWMQQPSGSKQTKEL